MVFFVSLPVPASANRVEANLSSIEQDYDVIVAGGGISGIAAALQAHKLGASVLVVEPSGWIGGQATAAAVSNMDDLLPTRSGLYNTFIAKARRYYDQMGKSMGTTYWNPRSIAFEPSVGQRKLYEMVSNARAANSQPFDILLHSDVTSVHRQENTVTGVTVQNAYATRHISSRVLIDATEYGDVIPLTGAPFRAGNSIYPNINPEAVIQDITWVAIIKKYPNGIPEHLRVTEQLPGYDHARQVFQRFVTPDGGTFEGVFPIRLPVCFITHNIYRGLPDSSAEHFFDARRENWQYVTKTGVNWANDFPGHVIPIMYGLPVRFLIDREARAQYEREAFIRTLHFIYYMQNELGESWSIADDEFLDDAPAWIIESLPESWREIARRMPPIPYVRESLRIIGDYTLTSGELFRNSQSFLYGESHEFEDSIGIAWYMIDLHATNRDDDMEADLGENHATFHLHQPRGPFQIPMRALIPRDLDGFLAAEKNLSMSRQVSGTIRLQPPMMGVGQAAGALAGLAVRYGVTPREVPAVRVQRALLDGGVDLSLSNFSDVPQRHRFHRAVQLASLYRLMDPTVMPRVPSPAARGIRRVFEILGAQGIFGIDRSVTQNEMAAMINKARTASRTGIGEDITGGAGTVTRTIFLESVQRAFSIEEAIDALGIPNLFGINPNFSHPITRGEAAEILMRAMTI